VIVGILLRERREYLHGLLRLVRFEQAIGQQESRFQFQRLPFVEQVQMGHGFGQPSELVVRQRQVHPHLGIVRHFPQGQVVFRDGGGELSVPRQSGSQIRTDFGRVGIILEERPVEPDGSGQISGLVGRVGFAQMVRGRIGPKRGQPQHNRQNDRRDSHPMPIITWGRLSACGGLSGRLPSTEKRPQCRCKKYR